MTESLRLVPARATALAGDGAPPVVVGRLGDGVGDVDGERVEADGAEEILSTEKPRKSVSNAGMRAMDANIEGERTLVSGSTLSPSAEVSMAETSGT